MRCLNLTVILQGRQWSHAAPAPTVDLCCACRLCCVFWICVVLADYVVSCCRSGCYPRPAVFKFNRDIAGPTAVAGRASSYRGSVLCLQIMLCVVVGAGATRDLRCLNLTVILQDRQRSQATLAPTVVADMLCVCNIASCLQVRYLAFCARVARSR